MAPSLFNCLAICFCMLTSLVSAETRTYNFTVGWVTRNPDGLQPRPVIGINGEWPIPRIEANVGDRVVVIVHNDLGNQSTSLHFHGLYMNGTNHMDGISGVTQCPIPPGSTFTYDFTINQAGTYWYHSHIDGQYPDGLRGPLIVNDPENPFKDQYDEELVVTLSDWYHDEMKPLIAAFLSVTNPTGAEPVPNAALMNETQNMTIAIQPGKTYFLRLINIGAFASQYFWIEGHTMSIIEVDGIYHEPADAEMIYISAAQRYGMLITAKNDTSTNYAMVASMDEDLFDQIPESLNPNVTSFLLYNDAAPLPEPTPIDEFDPFDDFTLVPYDKEPLFENPALSIELAVLMDNLGDGVNYAFFNDITYVRQTVPSLYTALSSGDMATNAEIYGINSNTFVLGHNEVIEMVINNHDPGKHPFHLHGHAFQAVARGEDESGDWDPEAVANGTLTLPQFPMRRDTFVVRPDGHIVIRFRSDNPGVWLFHCHIEWHVDSGLIMTLVEAPMELQSNLTIPQDHYAACASASPAVPTAGNAAGNTVDLLDLTGANVSPSPLPEGFTPRGIVALTFSIIAGLVGCAVIAWYGMGEMSSITKEREQRNIDDRVKTAGVADEGTANEDDDIVPAR